MKREATTSLRCRTYVDRISNANTSETLSDRPAGGNNPEEISKKASPRRGEGTLPTSGFSFLLFSLRQGTEFKTMQRVAEK